MTPEVNIGVLGIMALIFAILLFIRIFTCRYRPHNRGNYCSEAFFGLGFLSVLGSGGCMMAKAQAAIAARPNVTDLNVIREGFLKLTFAESIFFLTSLWCLKSAFLAQFWGVRENFNGRRLQWMMWASTAFMAVTYIASITLVLAECRPLSSIWTKGIHSCYPHRRPHVVATYTGLHIAGDILGNYHHFIS